MANAMNIGAETPWKSMELDTALQGTRPNEAQLLDIVRRKDWPMIIFSQPPPSLKLIGTGFTLPQEYFPHPQLNIRVSRRELKYSMSTDTFVTLLQQTVRSGSTFFRLEGRSGNTSQYKSPKGLVFTSVVLSQPEVQDLRGQGFNQAVTYLEDHRYGSVVLRFPYDSVARPGQQCFKLGTRVYLKEHSQVVLVDQGSPEEGDDYDSEYLMAYEAQAYHLAEAYNYGRYFSLPQGLGNRRTLEGEVLRIVHPLERIQNLEEMVWPLAFNSEGEWTHPEVAFLGSLNIPIHSCSVEYVRHSCRTAVRSLCTECDLSPWEIKRTLAHKLDQLPGMRQEVMELQQRNPLFSNDNLI